MALPMAGRYSRRGAGSITSTERGASRSRTGCPRFQDQVQPKTEVIGSIARRNYKPLKDWYGKKEIGRTASEKSKAISFIPLFESRRRHGSRPRYFPR